jgi:MFS transporter, ACS family, tartrate transporter
MVWCLTPPFLTERIRTPMAQPEINTVLSEAEFARTTLRKISLRLIPLLAVCYAVAYIDRVNVSFAALQMNKDLHFSAAVYGFGAGVFFLSYAACEVPANLLLMRFGARRWIARIMVTWGFLASAMVLVTKPWEFYALRFLLGVAEAGFFPGVIYYLTLWFPQRERARAISRFYIAIPISSMLMASISGPLLGWQGRLGFAGWQWLFLVEAVPAVVLGIVVFMLLPDGPALAHWLAPEERTWVENSLKQEIGTDARLRRSSVGGALRDRRIWQLGFLLLVTSTGSYAYSLTAPLLIKEVTAFSNNRVGLIVTAIAFCTAVAVIANGTALSEKPP